MNGLDYSPTKSGVQDAITNLKIATETTWLALGYDNDKISIVGNGKGSIKGCLNYVSPDKLLYIVVNIFLSGFPNKYAFISWSGARVKPKQRGLAPVHRETLKKLVEDTVGVQLATDYIISMSDEINDEQMLDKVFGSLRRRGSVPRIVSRAQPVNQITTTLVGSSSPSPVKQGSLNIKTQLAQQLSIDNSIVSESLKDIQQTKKRWCLLQYDDNGVLSVKITGEKDSSDEFLPSLSDKDMQYIVIKLNMGDTLGYGSDAEKVLFVTYAGPKVNPVRRAKLNQHKQQVYDFCNSKIQLAGDYEATDLKELNDTNLRNQAAGNRSNVKSSPAAAPVATVAAPLKRQTPVVAAVAQPEKTTTLSPTSGIGASKNIKSVPLISQAAMFAVSKMKNSLSTVTNAVQTIGVKAAKVPTAPARILPLQKGDGCIKIINEDEAVDKLNKLAFEFETNIIWAAFGYEGKNISDLKLLEVGSDRLMDSQDLIKTACPDNQLKFIIVKAYTSRGSEDDYRLKFAIVTWKGPKLRAVYKAISANHAQKLKTTVYRLIKFSTELEVSDWSEMDEQKIFRDNTILTLEKAKSVFPYKAPPPSEPVKTPRSARGQQATADPTLAAVHVPSSRSSVSRGTSTPAQNITDHQKMTNALNDLQNDSSATNWVLVGYETAAGLNMMSSGSNGLDGFKKMLQNDQINFIFYKFIVEETGYGATPKIVMIVWIGKDVKTIKTAQSASHRANLLAFANRTATIAAEYEANTISDLDEASIRGKITGKKGSAGYKKDGNQQQPSQISFGGKSQNLKFKDEGVIKNALKDLHDDNTTTNWIALKYNGEELAFFQKGTEGLTEFTVCLTEMEVVYIFYKLFVNSLSYGGGPKIAYIVWVGLKSSSSDKARSSAHRMALRDFANGVLAIAAEIPAETKDDVSEANILGKVTGSKGRVEGDKTPSLESTANNAPRRFGGKDSTLKFTDEAAVLEDFKSLRANKSGIRWLMFTYDPQDSYKVYVVHKGDGGAEKFKPHLDDNHIYFIIFRLSIIEYGDIAKCVIVTWVGENVENFQKAKSSGHRYNLMEYSRKHVSIGGQFDPQSLGELTDDAIVFKITGGSKEKEVDPSVQIITQNKPILIQPKSPVVEQDAVLQKEVEFSGKEEIKAALLELLGKPNEMDFVKLEISGKNMRDIKVLEKGKGCLSDEWKAQHLLPNTVNSFILTVSSSEKGYGLVVKYVIVQWIGASVKHIIKSKANEIRWSLYKFCDNIVHLSGELPSCQLPDEVTKEKIIEKISGTRVRGTEMKLKAKDDKYTGLGKDKKSQFEIDKEEEIDAALAELIKEDSEINWFGCCYKEGSIDVIRYDKKGNGHLAEWKQELKPESFYFVVHTVKHAFGYQKDFADTMSKTYNGLFQWQGPEVGLIEKALSSHHWNSFEKRIKKKLEVLKSNIQGGHYHAEKIEEITLERIKKTMNLYD